MPERSPTDQRALKALGHAVEKRRILSSVPQATVAHEAGISERFLRDLEAGYANPSYLRLLAIAKALKCDVRDLMP